MDKLSFEANDLTPGILFDKEKGVFEIYGKSCPPDVIEFYQPVFDWLDNYKKEPLDKTCLDFKLTYFNTLSAKLILKLMTKMEDLVYSGYDVKIRWYYKNDDYALEEAGEEFGNIVNVNFEYIPVQDGKPSYDNTEFEKFMEDLIKL